VNAAFFRRENLLAALLLGALCLQAVPPVFSQSPTSDEFSHHVPSGHSYWVTRDFRMNPASPPLPRMLTALPLLFTRVRAPLDDVSWREGNAPAYARKFFYESGEDAQRLIVLARLPILVLSLLFGAVLFAWTRRRFGPAAALGALALYAFCPNVIAHSSLATADLAVAFFIFLTLAGFGSYLEEPSWKKALTTGVWAGAAFLSKFTALVLLPLLPLIALFGGRFRALSPAKIAGFLGVTLLTIWAGYCFELKPLLENTPDPAKKEAVYRSVGGESFVRFARQAPVPLSTFSSALVSMLVTRARGTNAFLLGEWSGKGWWYYYFIAFAVKNTLPFVFLSISSFFLVRRLRLPRLDAAVCLVPVAFFFAATLNDRAQAGIRYFLPIYPLLFALSGATLAYLWARGRAWKALAAALLAWHALSAALIFPHPLAYFNEASGGPDKGYRILRDSNLDWGQDLPSLAAYVKRVGNPEVALFYYGPADPRQYRIWTRPLEPAEMEEPQANFYAIGAHGIDAVRWTTEIQPTAVIGHSIFVYDLREDEA